MGIRQKLYHPRETWYSTGMGDPLFLTDTATDKARPEKKEYLSQQLITYIGSKRALLGFIESGIRTVQKKLNKDKLKMFDVFSGSGIVARFFKRFSDLLIVNDLEQYAKITNECYLANEAELNLPLLRGYYRDIIREANDNPVKGIISQLYAPQDDTNIKPGERVFYTTRNAVYIDTVRHLTEQIPSGEQKFFLAPLLSEASIHANTSGIFKGFYKNKETGTGQYGGNNKDALKRITGDIQLPFPVFSVFNCETIIYNQDSNTLINTLPEVDVAYIDPPYNQHPYGSNYFMLNLIVDYQRPKNTSAVSGIPTNWNRSNYNKENRILETLTYLVENIKAKFVIISFNSDGFIHNGEMITMLTKFGKVDVLETRYNVFRGGRNLKRRTIHVKEYLYLLEK